MKKVFTQADPWPDLAPGTICVVNEGDYRRMEIWVVCGSNIGNMYPLGNLYHQPEWREITKPAGWTGPRDPFDRDHDENPRHPEWADMVARGPVTIMVPAGQDGYGQGWKDGRKRFLEQIEELGEDEDRAPARETGFVPPQGTVEAVLAVLTRTHAAEAKGLTQDGISGMLRRHHLNALTALYASSAAPMEDMLTHLLDAGLVRREDPKTAASAARWFAVAKAMG